MSYPKISKSRLKHFNHKICIQNYKNSRIASRPIYEFMITFWTVYTKILLTLRCSKISDVTLLCRVLTTPPPPKKNKPKFFNDEMCNNPQCKNNFEPCHAKQKQASLGPNPAKPSLSMTWIEILTLSAMRIYVYAQPVYTPVTMSIYMCSPRYWGSNLQNAPISSISVLFSKLKQLWKRCVTVWKCLSH